MNWGFHFLEPIPSKKFLPLPQSMVWLKKTLQPFTHSYQNSKIGMSITTLLKNTKPVIACIHLMALPGSPGYNGSMQEIIDRALVETEIYKKYQIDALIIENFRDYPFYPDKLPPETISSFTMAANEIIRNFNGPVGINALRNDAHAALAIALAVNADFIRVNVHTGATVTDQGLIQGKAFDTLRLRKNMEAENILIFADVAVKHASPLGKRDIELETRDLTERGMADAVIVSGNLTGDSIIMEDLLKVKKNTHLPVVIGSGTNPDNIEILYPEADAFIVGSYFKKDGKAVNFIEETRVKQFMTKFNSL
jgi:membrane complex biogenesis BtpA family protein